MPARLLVFDLDGTLIDSQVDLANSINATLLHFGKPELPASTIASYIGDGASTLVRRSLAHAHLIQHEADPHDETFIREALEWFIAYYGIHKLDYTILYPGVKEALKNIRDRHPELPMAVLTNKPVAPSRAICGHFGLDGFFFKIYGGNSFRSKKPDPEGLLAALAEANALRTAERAIAPDEMVMIGDSHVDVETARAAGAMALGCSYGLSPETLAAAKPDWMAERAEEWAALLGL